jgi:hypothetical protein
MSFSYPNDIPGDLYIMNDGDNRYDMGEDNIEILTGKTLTNDDPELFFTTMPIDGSLYKFVKEDNTLNGVYDIYFMMDFGDPPTHTSSQQACFGAKFDIPISEGYKYIQIQEINMIPVEMNTSLNVEGLIPIIGPVLGQTDVYFQAVQVTGASVVPAGCNTSFNDCTYASFVNPVVAVANLNPSYIVIFAPNQRAASGTYSPFFWSGKEDVSVIFDCCS